jgi:hypothetical protein
MDATATAALVDQALARASRRALGDPTTKPAVRVLLLSSEVACMPLLLPAVRTEILVRTYDAARVAEPDDLIAILDEILCGDEADTLAFVVPGEPGLAHFTKNLSLSAASLEQQRNRAFWMALSERIAPQAPGTKAAGLHIFSPHFADNSKHHNIEYFFPVVF